MNPSKNVLPSFTKSHLLPVLLLGAVIGCGEVPIDTDVSYPTGQLHEALSDKGVFNFPLASGATKACIKLQAKEKIKLQGTTSPTTKVSWYVRRNPDINCADGLFSPFYRPLAPKAGFADLYDAMTDRDGDTKDDVPGCFRLCVEDVKTPVTVRLNLWSDADVP